MIFKRFTIVPIPGWKKANGPPSTGKVVPCHSPFKLIELEKPKSSNSLLFLAVCRCVFSNKYENIFLKKEKEVRNDSVF
ncbi:hypothetical protein QQG55_15890 [Brugia pahangi]